MHLIRAFTALSLILVPGIARAALDVRVEFYDERGLLLRGEGTVHGLAGAVPGHEFVQEWLAPIDEGARAPGGHPGPQTLAVRIPLGPVSVELHRLHSSGARLEKVVLGFLQPDRDGLAVEFYRVTLHEAAVASILTESLNNRYPENLGLPITDLVRLIFASHESESGEAGFIFERLVFLRGDTNGDLGIDLGDAMKLLLFLFRGSRLGCPVAGDADGNGLLEIADAIYVLKYLFLLGPPIPAPPGCEPLPLGAFCDAAACKTTD